MVELIRKPRMSTDPAARVKRGCSRSGSSATAFNPELVPRLAVAGPAVCPDWAFEVDLELAAGEVATVWPGEWWFDSA